MKNIFHQVEAEKKVEKKRFCKMCVTELKKFQKRTYIDPAGGTVDYVLLFIPNDSIILF